MTDSDLPRIVSSVTASDGGEKKHIQELKRWWPEALWPLFSFLILAFNCIVAGAFIGDLYLGHYDYIKHITTIATLCGSYWFCVHIHYSMLEHIDGR